ncbi:hypothetical protein ZHAS_00010656 [Anopheles sinensis]|uniref:Pupal cuticle protein n=1 Tax=Anopheles sinensis TaxID=74873 RepID=A0A084VY53_ANOSI|nr:hypothetical protein ZHAS_00010656 [Anopheles sinensis]
MFKAIIFVTLFVGVCYAGLVHHHQDDDDVSETEHHHNIEHKHATSHQSFKFHHFHAVPVYVKKEDQQFLKHPVEISGLKHNLKNHSEFESKIHGGHGYDLGHAGTEHVGQEHYGGHEYEHHQFGHELDEQEE